MPKHYLNRDERNTAVAIGAFIMVLDKQATKHANLQPISKYFRTAKTYTEKALEEILRPLDVKERAKVVVESQKMRVIATYTDDALREAKRVEDINKVTPVATDDFLDLCGHAITNTCQVCTKAGSDAVNCPIKGLFIKYDVEPLDLNAEDCPYKYE